MMKILFKTINNYSCCVGVLMRESKLYIWLEHLCSKLIIWQTIQIVDQKVFIGTQTLDEENIFAFINKWIYPLVLLCVCVCGVCVFSLALGITNSHWFAYFLKQLYWSMSFMWIIIINFKCKCNDFVIKLYNQF